MDTFEGAAGAKRQPNMKVGTCWECGEELLCTEYIVCCTGTVFHICPKCEQKVNESGADDHDSESVRSDSPGARKPI